MTPQPSPRRRSPWDDWYRRTLPAYWLFLFCLTHFPLLKLEIVAGGDWIAHGLAYALLAFLFWRFAETFSRPRSGRFVWLAGLWIGLYGIFDEWSQPFFNRGAEALDLMFDGLGAGLVLAILERHRRRAAQSAAQTAGKTVDSAAVKR